MAMQLSGEGADTVMRLDADDIFLGVNVMTHCEVASDITADLGAKSSEHPLTALLQFTLDQSGVGARLSFEGLTVKGAAEVRSRWAQCCVPQRIDAEQVVAILGTEKIFGAEVVVPAALGLATSQFLRHPVLQALHKRAIDLCADLSCLWDDSQQNLIVEVYLGEGAVPDLAMTFSFPRDDVKEIFGVA